MKDFCELPQNLLRKVLNFKHCIANLEELQRVFGFTEDKAVNQVLQILRAETERVQAELRKEENKE